MNKSEKRNRVISVMSEFDCILEKTLTSFRSARECVKADNYENSVTNSIIDSEVRACLKDLTNLCERHNIKR